MFDPDFAPKLRRTLRGLLGIHYASAALAGATGAVALAGAPAAPFLWSVAAACTLVPGAALAVAASDRASGRVASPARVRSRR